MSFLAIVRQRLVLLILVVLGVSAVTFAISHLVPGDPARLLAGDRASDATVEHMRHALGLDRSLWVQYGMYLHDLVHGDFGVSIRTQRPVSRDILAFFPATLELAFAALSLAVLLGVPLGIVSAVSKDRMIDHVSRTLSVVGVSTPAFWLGLVVIYLFYGRLGVLPGSGRIGADVPSPVHFTGIYTVDAIVSGNWRALGSTLFHLVLPAFTLAFLLIGVVTRQIRSAMLEVLQEDYIRTAKASGLTRRRIIFDHALRNALISSVTVLGLAFGDLLYGSVLTETVFAWPGMGSYVVQSIAALDFSAIMGFTVVVSAAYVLVNLAVDLAYMVLDPQIRRGL
jgi:peptide/nickel transport system permease protein